MIRLGILSVSTAFLLCGGPAGAQAPAPGGPVTDKLGVERRPAELQADPVQAFDINHDGFIGPAEAKSAAAARYDGLNPSHDERLTPKQAASAMTAEEFKQADADKDGHLNKAEYLALTLKRFKAADADHHGRVSRQELDKPAGQSLLKLLR